MPRPERPLDPSAGPRERFANDLRLLRREAGSRSYEQLARQSHYSRTAFSEAAGGRVFPSWEVTRAFVSACGGDVKTWAERWAATQRALSEGAPPELVETLTPNVAGRVITVRQKRPRRWVLIATIVAVAVISAAAGVFVSPLLETTRTVQHSDFLGDVDLEKACQSQGFTGATLDGATAADWYCTKSPGTRQSLSINEACRQQYQRPTALARDADPLNPNSWQCWDNVVVIGRIDIDRYCRGHGYPSTQLEPTGIDTWDCVSTNGTKFAIDHDSACRWQFGAQVIVAGPGPFHSPWEHWDCWG